MTEHEIVKYDSFSHAQRKLAMEQRRLYDSHHADYHAHIAAHLAYRRGQAATTASSSTSPLRVLKFSRFISFKTWLGGTPVPGSKVLMNHYTDAFYHKNLVIDAPGDGPGKLLSINDVLTRHMQSAACDGGSSDHTFAAATQGIHDKDVKQLYSFATHDQIISFSVFTANTSHAQIIHALECAAHRSNFDPKEWITDDWPEIEKMLKAHFPDCDGLLGIFHFCARLKKAIRKHHKNYGKSCARLKKCIWKWVQEHIDKVKQALRDGTLNGKKFTEQAIQDMEDSGELTRKYRRYIAHSTRPAMEIEKSLREWMDDEKIGFESKDLSLAGLTLGYRNGRDIVEAQMTHCRSIEAIDRGVLASRKKPNEV